MVNEFIIEHNHFLHLPSTVHMMPSQRKVAATHAIEIDLAHESGLRLKQSWNNLFIGFWIIKVFTKRNQLKGITGNPKGSRKLFSFPLKGSLCSVWFRNFFSVNFCLDRNKKERKYDKTWRKYETLLSSPIYIAICETLKCDFFFFGNQTETFIQTSQMKLHRNRAQATKQSITKGGTQQQPRPQT